MGEKGETHKANRGPAAAEENRRALIAAARELFAEKGFAVPFSAVARRAGVGQASLYRHFPDKVALGVAVFAENLADLEKHPLDLHGFLEEIAGQARVSASLLEALIAARTPRAHELAGRLRALIEGILEREGLDPSVTADDVQAAVSMVAFHTAATPTPDAAERAIAIVERGLRAR